MCCNPSKKALIGYNDMWTINPELAKLLLDPQDGYKYMQNSGKPVDWKCPNCGEVINKMINNVAKQGFHCPRCSDGLSYPEKFMYSILQKLNINFTYQYRPEWCKYELNNKIKQGRYDFYFKLNDKEYIIEMDGGLGHSKSDNYLSGQTKEQSKLIDDYKDRVADKHTIKVIRIDCDYNYDRFTYIKNKIIDSKLNDIFNLSNIDWLKCSEFACSSLVKKACSSLVKKACALWNLNKYTTTEIGNILKLDRTTIVKYLKQGSKIKFCDYDSQKIHREKVKKLAAINKKKVICLNNERIYDGLINAEIETKVQQSNILYCCKNKIKYAGIDKETGKYLQWKYYEDYLVNPKKLLSNEEINKLKKYNRKKSSALIIKKYLIVLQKHKTFIKLIIYQAVVIIMMLCINIVVKIL